jgi:hypothetical protein
MLSLTTQPFEYYFVQVSEEAHLSFRYETPSALLLRGILRRDDPTHAAILDSFPETRREPSKNENTTANLGNANTQPVIKRGIKREIKRENDALTSTAAFQDVVHLAGDSQTRSELSQDLICDLTGDDDAPPHWSKKRQG